MTVLNVTRRVMMAATAATLTLGAPVFADGHQVAESIHFLIPGGAGGGWDSTARGTGMVLRNAGPKGAPGMPESGYIPIPKKLVGQFA